ncbi:glycoside hydrolase family 2 TIM barrel-domain containing protein [Zunongwangia sp.]|uniref:glycoside hydrolase family 2 TIM barrel-domain containing protein n=1 Tax=Zunongwangia sp. TaxID=1965325 RepID=UPI003AA9B66E
MENKITKNIYRAGLIITFIALNGLILFGISSVLAWLNTGADRTGMLHTEVLSKDVYLPKITWGDTVNPGRPMELQTLGEIQQDYLNAWYVKEVAYKTNNPYGIEDYYTDSSRVNLFETIAYNEENNIHFEATTLQHEPDLEFYSADGQLVVITDKNVIEYQEVYENNQKLFTHQDTANYKVMLLLEDGFWRIRHLQKELATPNQDSTISSKIASVKNGKIYIENKPFSIKGINYYPQHSAWDLFGDNFSEDTLRKDFKIIKDASLNSIRIFIQYEDFGKADVVPEKLQKLNTLLNVAEEEGLKVVVTLFDFYGNYSVLDWTLTFEHARQIVETFKNHPAIIAWDLKNEPDLDFDSRGEELVLEWLSHLTSEIRKTDPNHLLTIGWSTPDIAEKLQNKLDFVSFHFYKDLDKLEEDYSILQKKVNKPLVLQEFGMSSYHGLWNFFGDDEEDQANYHQKIQSFFKEKDLAFMSWTLYDFPKVPTDVVGIRPWRKSRQKHFGFIDLQGMPKPAFKYINHKNLTN